MKEKEILEAKAKIEEGIRLINEGILMCETNIAVQMSSFRNEEDQDVLYLTSFEVIE